MSQIAKIDTLAYRESSLIVDNNSASISNDSLLQCLSSLSWKNCLNCAQVNKQWNQVGSSSAVWKKFLKRCFPYAMKDAANGEEKKLFLKLYNSFYKNLKDHNLTFALIGKIIDPISTLKEFKKGYLLSSACYGRGIHLWRLHDKTKLNYFMTGNDDGKAWVITKEGKLVAAKENAFEVRDDLFQNTVISYPLGSYTTDFLITQQNLLITRGFSDQSHLLQIWDFNQLKQDKNSPVSSVQNSNQNIAYQNNRISCFLETKEGLLVSGDVNGMVFIWDLKDPYNPVLMRTLPHTASIWKLFSMQCGKIIVCLKNEEIFVWDIKNDTHIPTTFNMKKKCNSILETVNGLIIFGDTDGGLHIWDLENPKPSLFSIFSDSKTPISALLESTEEFLFSVSQNIVKVWDLDGLKKKHNTPLTTLYVDNDAFPKDISDEASIIQDENGQFFIGLSTTANGAARMGSGRLYSLDFPKK